MYPDDVVSAHHLDGLAQDLFKQGWDVEALPCNRGCRDETRKYKKSDIHAGVRYRRVWRPGFSQKTFRGRLFNSAWMIAAWTAVAFRSRADKPDVVIVGTDPMFGLVVALPLRLFAPSIRIAHWCFDMHPEAAFASGVVKEDSLLGKLARSIMGASYRSCDLVADIGPCMRRRLAVYGTSARSIELTPWALSEPAQPAGVDPETRKDLFGDASVGLLYSGNFGEAHSYEPIISLARELRDDPRIHFCLAVRGNEAELLKQAVTEEDRNISFAGFAKLEDLEKRLGSADIHIASLKEAWAGIAVPSKFFGSLSVGRPVLFCGPPDSAIGDWIRKHELGWQIDPSNVPEIANSIRKIASATNTLVFLQAHCHRIYNEYFSRKRITSEWSSELWKQLEQPQGETADVG